MSRATLTQTGNTATLTITDGVNTAVYTNANWNCTGGQFNIQSVSPGCKKFPATITVNRCPAPPPPPPPGQLPQLWAITNGGIASGVLFSLYDLNTGHILRSIDTAFATNVPFALTIAGMTVTRNTIYYSQRGYPHIFTYDLTTGGWGFAFQTEFGGPYINGTWIDGGLEMLGFDPVQDLLYVKPHPASATFTTRLYNTYNFGSWTLQSRINSNPLITQSPFLGGIVPFFHQNVVECAPEPSPHGILTGNNGYNFLDLTGDILTPKFIAPTFFAGIDFDGTYYYVAASNARILLYDASANFVQTVNLDTPAGVTAGTLGLRDISLIR